jgi:hypothetical protein
MTHPINAAPTFNSALDVPDDGDKAIATAPGSPAPLVAIEELAQKLLDNTKALESWAVSTLYPASSNNALVPATFDPRLVGRLWSHPAAIADATAVQLDNTIDWRDRDLFALVKDLGGTLGGRGDAAPHQQNTPLPVIAWGFLGTGGLDGPGGDPATSGLPPANSAGKFLVRFGAPDVRLFARTTDGSLWVFNNTGGPVYLELWIFGTGRTTGGDGGSASADGSTTVLGGGGNATQLQGRNLSNTAPADGDVIAWDAGASKWQPTAPAAPPSSAPSWVDTIRYSATVTTVGANWTVGARFRVTRAGRDCTGVRFYWPDAGGQTVRCRLWSAGGASLASMDVVTAGAGVYTATFGAAVALTPGVDYVVSTYSLSTDIALSATGTAGTTSPLMPVMMGAEYLLLWSYLWEGGGDVFPVNASVNNTPIEPTLTG